MARVLSAGWAVVCVLMLAAPARLAFGMSRQEKLQYKERVLEMFYHAYYSYMDHAYPADELMPLSCRGRVRGQERSRGDVDDALGRFSLTLIDSLDTLAVIGSVDEFNSAVRAVVRDVNFDTDLVVSVFETNIRVLGGLLGGHFAAVELKERGHRQLAWYGGQLLAMAEDIGQRLLPAFNTSTGLPYPKVNLRHGMGYENQEKTTCTACAGTLMLEFAALSRMTGNPEYELRAHHAMEALWKRRHQGHDLVGSVINVHNGEWTRRDSGVGAGIDSYYEYCLKSYVALGDQEYLRRFDKHYSAIMKYISNGPLLVDVSMTSPNRMSRNFMDSLLAFWPGLQVLWGDLDSAIHTHDMLYHVTERHNFLPEAFTLDFKVHWGSHLLRPEFIESTYLLYKATGDPYYLDIGKTVMANLNEFARVPCGFAAIKNVQTLEHEDRMDSYVLAETFKYLFLLFSEEEDLLLDLEQFVFTTEAHLIPLSLATINTTHSLNELRARLFTNTSQATTGAAPSEHAEPADKMASGDKLPRESLTLPLQCPNDRRPFVQFDEFEKLMLKQCTSSRFRVGNKRKPKRPPRLTIHSLDFSNLHHLIILKEMGIVVESMEGGRIQVSHLMQKAKTPEDADEGWHLMQDIMKFMTTQQNPDGTPKRDAKLVRVLQPLVEPAEFVVGPALFGPNLGTNNLQISAVLVETEPTNGCVEFPDRSLVEGKILLVSRGGCLFVHKVRNAEMAGAVGAIVADNLEYDSTNISANLSQPQMPFSMSGDDRNNIHIPAVFMQKRHAEILRGLLMGKQDVQILLTWLPLNYAEGEGEAEVGGEGEKDSSEDGHGTTKCSSGDCAGRPGDGSSPLFDDGAGSNSEGEEI